ncbi:unnamed protein product, partial [Heterotrigona itama]
DLCTIDGSSGVCVLLDEEKCPSVYQNLLAGITPSSICGYKGFMPIICCPTKFSTSTTKATTTIRTTTTSRPTTRTTTTTTTSSSVIDDRPSLNRVGAKARAKCEEYSKSVYALVHSPVLTLNQKLVNVSLCGIKTRKLIVGGTKAESKEFPHMAAIGYDSRNGVVWQCGGTGKANWARLGDLNLIKTDDDARPQDFHIVQRIRHPEYSIQHSYHDIALFKLEKNVEFNAYVRPSCLPYSSSDVGTENKATATGWGANEYFGDPTNDLLKVTINLVPQSICNESYGYEAKLPRGIGDSGGPLSIFNPDYDCMYNLIGVTSFGIICGGIVPGVYTRVYNYISWIESVVWPDR